MKYTKEFKAQPIVQIDDFDTYGCYRTMACMILPLLQQFRKDMTGYPDKMFVLLKVRDDQPITPELADRAMDLWYEIIDQMIAAFEAILKNEQESQDFEHPVIVKGLALFATYFTELWI